ncbi:MAG: YggS family pyridoxal phosphate-dependent enzyme [Alphaproteobacteria bacterium]
MAKTLIGNDYSETADAGTTLQARLAGVRGEMEQAVAARLPGMGGAPPVLLGASKGQPVSVLEEAIGLGLTDFGENRVQEALAKWRPIKEVYPRVRLHLIGPLQSNKAKEAVGLFDVIQTIDREKLADAVGDASARLGRTPECFLQVNTGEEPQKGGVAPPGVEGLLRHAVEKSGLKVTGLMAVPPAGENPAPHFALLKKLADEFGLTQLSMGMSHDFALAIRLGATCVRIGTRLFGPRADAAAGTGPAR